VKHALRRAVCTAALALPLAAIAAEEGGGPKPEDFVHYRQGVMTAIGWNFGPMAAMVKKEMPYDAAEFARRAERVAFLATLPMEGFVPQTKGIESHAKDAVWDNLDDFESRMKDLETNTAALASAAKGASDLGAVVPAFAKVGETCKGCHDEYEQD
jgi:cytochrome c556